MDEKRKRLIVDRIKKTCNELDLMLVVEGSIVFLALFQFFELASNGILDELGA